MPTVETQQGDRKALRGEPSRPIALGLLAAVVASGVGYGAVRAVTWRDRKQGVAELRDALRAYAECILGAPLGPGETASARLKRIEVTLSEPSEASASLWPDVCRKYVDRAHAAIVSHRSLATDSRARELDAMVVAARSDPSPADRPDLVGEILASAPALGFSAAPRPFVPPGTPVAPLPATPLVARDFPPLAVRSSLLPDELTNLDPATLRLAFFDRREATWTCAFTPAGGEPLRQAHCSERVRGAVSSHDEGVRPSGFVRTTHGRFDRFELVRPVRNADPDVVPLPDSLDTVALFGDQLVWVKNHRWYARTAGAGRSALTPPVDLGEVRGTAAELAGCVTSSAFVVAVKTFDDSLEPRQSWRALAAWEGGVWRRTPGHAVVDVGATLTCEGHAATWTWFDRKVVSQVACNRDRCETRRSGPVTLTWDVGAPLYAADLGGRALLIGLGSTPGPLTGRSVTSVRMRIAPLAAMATATDTVLFSDAAHDGAPLEAITLYVRDGVALVLLRGEGEEPYRAIRVDALGRFSAVLPAD